MLGILLPLGGLPIESYRQQSGTHKIASFITGRSNQPVSGVYLAPDSCSLSVWTHVGFEPLRLRAKEKCYRYTTWPIGAPRYEGANSFMFWLFTQSFM